MAQATEINSLEEINYRSPSKLKALGVTLLGFFLMIIGFVNFFPLDTIIRGQINAQLRGSPCKFDYQDLSINMLFAQVVMRDITLPAACFNREGESLRLNHVTLNYHLINFFPLGLPFRLDTELQGQPLSVHYVLGLGGHMVRVKDQKIALQKIMPLIAPQVRLAGNMTVDLTGRLTGQGQMTSMHLKAVSKNLELPGQDLQGFNLPNMKLNDFYLEAHSDNPPRIIIDRLMVGNPKSPIRANFKGRIDLQEANPAMSPMELTGEVAFAPSLIESIPLLEMLMGPYPQKDGFYQVRLGGTLGAPKGSAP